MFFGLRTPIDKVVRSLSLLSEGMGQNALSRQEGVTKDALRNWIVLAARHVNELTDYLQRDMKLGQVQIDEFWSFIRKKNKSDEIGHLGRHGENRSG